MTEKNSLPKGYVRLKHTGMADQRSILATNMLIQHNDIGEFFLSFFETPPPVLLGTDEERAKEMESITELETHCVARIMVSKERMPGIINALAENYKRYTELESGKEKGQPNGQAYE